MTAATMGRQSRQLVRSLAGAWSGRDRGPDRKVRRNSYDIEDRRAKVFRRVADGTKSGALAWIDCLLKTVSEWDDMQRRKGGARPLGFAGLRVLEVLLGRRGKTGIDFKTGRLDPSLETIAAAARLSKTTVVRALANLERLKILRWIRRSVRTENAGGYGPQRAQASNAYWFDLTELPKCVLQRFTDLLARRRLNREQNAPPPHAKPPREMSPELTSSLARLGAAVERVNASPPSGQYPCSGVKG